MADGSTNDVPDPELTEEIAMELYTVVCKNGGIIEATDVPSLLGERAASYIKQYGFYPLLQSSFRGVLKLQVEKPSNRATFQGITSVDVCNEYKQSKCTSPCCSRLHVCSFFIQGECRFGDRCRYNHNLQGEHEQKIILENKLNQLDEASLISFLRLELYGSISSNHGQDICRYYNTGTDCSAGNHCLKLHICSWFEKGKCKDGMACPKSHNLDEEITRVSLLRQERERVKKERTAQLMFNAFNTAMFMGAQYFMTAQRHGSSPSIDEICGFHLKGTCQYGKGCNRYKHNLPYLWQIQITWSNNEEKWFPFSDSHNKEIEQDYCNVDKETSINVKIGQTSLVINFQDMVAKDDTGSCTACIRRLSTCSWLKASPNDNFATHWTWYWINDQNQWVAYNRTSQDATQDLLNAEKLEESLLSGVGTITLTLNLQQYIIDLKNMLQTNQSTGKVRNLRRRPSSFVGKEDIATRRNKPQTQSQIVATGSIFPRHWSRMTENQEVVMVVLDASSQEYRQAETEFKKTLNAKTIRKIERIENADLWECYFRKRSRLSRKLNRPVEERRLFHGTSENSVKAICQQGFDWRLCGAHGTAFGKGSYFARDASYSDGYSSTSPNQGGKMMFFAHVIVGSVVIGNSSTVRPPPISAQKPHELHNTCVDNLANPSIFVIFENDQAYPEYLITYV